jgi:hypothetical protein
MFVRGIGEATTHAKRCARLISYRVSNDNPRKVGIEVIIVDLSSKRYRKLWKNIGTASKTIA